MNWAFMYAYVGVSAAHMWATLRALLPPKGSGILGPFERIQAFVKKHQLMTAQKIDVCTCGETIYHDFKDAAIRRKFPFSSNRRKVCGLCGEDRFLYDKHGYKKARRHMWYFPYRYIKIPLSMHTCSPIHAHNECSGHRWVYIGHCLSIGFILGMFGYVLGM